MNTDEMPTDDTNTLVTMQRKVKESSQRMASVLKDLEGLEDELNVLIDKAQGRPKMARLSEEGMVKYGERRD